ncbi:hypothetical protein YPS_1302 [Yersinia pestis Pestoides A]|nr:hypothetical protein YPS_1302 [Yersinia pestis Pestoides A]
MLSLLLFFIITVTYYYSVYSVYSVLVSGEMLTTEQVS